MNATEPQNPAEQSPAEQNPAELGPAELGPAEYRRANRRAAWRWGSFVVGLLGLQVAGGIVAIILATGDESVAVVPNYHEKALNWDAEMAAQAASAALGWKCEVSQIRDVPNRSGLRITLTDREGLPVVVKSGALRLYRHVRASDVRQVPIPPGKFARLEIADCFDQVGLWQVMLDLNGENGERFLHSQELSVTQSEQNAGLQQ